MLGRELVCRVRSPVASTVSCVPLSRDLVMGAYSNIKSSATARHLVNGCCTDFQWSSEVVKL